MNNSVPTGWSLQPLSALAHYYNGRAFKPEDWSSEGLPIIRIAQINNKNTDLDYYAGDDVSDKNRIINGDLLFSWSATLTALIWNRGDAVLNQHIFKVEEKAGVDRKYLHQVILNSIEPLADYSHGSTMKHIKKGVLDEYCVGTPPLHEQQKIATILSSVDNVIEKIRAQIDKLKDLKTGMMQELLTKGIGHTEFKDSPVGRIPAEWTVKKLDDLSEKISDGIHTTPKYVEKSEYHFINGNNLQDGQIVIGDKTKCVPESEFIKLKRDLTDNTILMSINGTIGKLAFYAGEQVVLGKSAAFISLAKEQSKKFIFYVLQSQATTQFYDFELTGSTIKNLSLRTIKQTPVPIPTKKEQALIVSILSENDKKIRLKTELLNQVEALKKALMQDLLTGKVRVNLTDKESAVV